LITISRKTSLTNIAAILIIILVLPGACFVAQAQTETSFEPTDKFSLAEYNGSISFASGGTYSQAIRENGTWNFENLRLNNSRVPKNLKVSAQNSNITITSYQKSNNTFGSTQLRYVVTGQGKQTFKLDLNSEGGEWWVTFNSVFMANNDGWSVSPDTTITITGATSNVSISYYNFPDSLGGSSNNSKLPFYQQHSVAIAAAVTVAITAILVVVIRRKNDNSSGQSH
jgi:hypothetical protein